MLVKSWANAGQVLVKCLSSAAYVLPMFGHIDNLDKIDNIDKFENINIIENNDKIDNLDHSPSSVVQVCVKCWSSVGKVLVKCYSCVANGWSYR